MNLRTTGVLLAALALVATGCRDSEDEDGDGASAPGVTDEACPDAVNEDNGCIYLGTISDLTQGPFAPLGVPITEAQKAFWQRVNEDGGIGGYDINVTEYVRDNLYNPQTHKQVYGEIEGDVLALAQTFGSPTTLAIIPDMQSRRDGRRPGLLDLALGLRGRDPGVRHQLLRRGHERRRLHGRRAERHRVGDGRALPRRLRRRRCRRGRDRRRAARPGLPGGGDRARPGGAGRRDRSHPRSASPTWSSSEPRRQRPP